MQAFRPGIVDLNDDQAVSTINSITLTDNMTSLDLLLPDPPMQLNLTKNITNAQDITLMDVMYPFQSQTTEIDQSMEMEVGRDADVSRRFSQVLPQDLDESVEPLKFGEGEIDFGFDLDMPQEINDVGRGNEDGRGFEMPDIDLATGYEERAYEMPDIDLAPGYDQRDLDRPDAMQFDLPNPNEDAGLEFDLPVAEELNLSLSNVDMDLPVPSPASTPSSKRKKKPAQPRKRKLVVDKEIELNNDFIRQQLQNASDITVPESYIPFKNSFDMDLSSYYSIFPDMDRFFPTRSMAVLPLPPSQFLDIVHETEPPELPDAEYETPYDPYWEEDPMHKRARTDATDASNQTIVEESAVDLSMLPDESNYQLLEAPIFDDALGAPPMSQDATATIQELGELLKNESSVSFQEMTLGANRAAAAKVFFEVLALKTKNFIRVAQKGAFNDITITSTPLFDTLVV